MESEWEQVAADFWERWNFPNCIGAMDGKHILLQMPNNTGSYYYNYKNAFSLVLLALVDADYKFLYVDVGCNGRVSDGGVFRYSSLSEALDRNTLNVPGPAILPNDGPECPFVVVADDAFPLKENIMKPYGKVNLTKERRIFNYRLSRARRIVENAFGILTNRFRVFRSAIAHPPETVEKIVLASCVLHNLLRSQSNTRNIYTPAGALDSENTDAGTIAPGQWRAQGTMDTGMQPLEMQGGNRYAGDARTVRDRLCDYVNTAGQVEWQERMI